MILARNTDPMTSHQAAETVNVTKKQNQLLGLMVAGRIYISDDVDIFIPGIWRRIGECEKLGLIRFTGNTRKGRSGKQQREFQLTGHKSSENPHDRLPGAASGGTGFSAQEGNVVGENLTQVHNEDMARKIRDTPAGMAHWAGTGPKGMTCRMCMFFELRGYDVTGKIKKGSCLKFESMTGKKGAKIEHSNASCVKFEENGNPPTIFKAGRK